MVAEYGEIGRQGSGFRGMMRSPTYTYRFGGYMGPQRQHFHCDHHQLIPQSHPYARPFLPYAHDIRREIEKERIREEIIMSEIRRHELEAEVRRELMMETEMGLALRRPGNGLPFASPLPISLPPSPSEPLPFQRGRFSEVEPVHEAAKQKGRIILLANPSERTLRMKREASVSAGSKSPAESNLRKKAKEEWSCAICQVSTTSEHALKEHVQGKKHKLKVAGLKAPGVKNYIIGLYPKKAANATTNEPKVASKSLPSDDKTEEKSSKTDNGPLLDESLNSVKVKENIEPEQKLQKKKFKFWCKVCQVGCHSPIVFNTHVDGKKHKRRVNMSKRNYGAGPCNVKYDAEEEAIAEDCRDVVVNKSVDHDSTEEGVGGETKNSDRPVS